MDGGVYCLICFAEYTLTGGHRVISLKCGHLFGAECIEKWLNVYKRNYCPTCSAPCRKTHLRPIFAAKVEATDTEKEKQIIDKYIKENEIRKALEIEVSKLKSHIEILKSSFKQNLTATKPVGSKIHMRFVKYCKIHFFPDDSFVEFDAINQAVIISCRKNGDFGLFKYSLSNFSINSFIKFGDAVRDFKLSPFNDGLCLVAYSRCVSLLNIYTENTIKSLSFDTNVSAICFSSLDRDLIFVADMIGWLYICNLTSGKIKKAKVCNENIHSIASAEDILCVASVFGLYIHGGSSYEQISFKKLESDTPGICSGVTSDGRNVLAVFRNAEYTVSGILLGKKHIVFDPEVKQLFKHNDKVFNGYIMVCDDFRNAIKVLDLNTFQMVYSYAFKEAVVGFCGDSTVLAVLTKRGIYIYDNG
ncbi:uncharacterized protein VICG_01267 [Vittaforma corneae ATCC 50505]|uniref:RING-type domain-containing protein n=1 Tax=Vittaforma corneae (strain ATCC 50505) TaxID=993615 RepID=L2GLZ1_VITCO|nr:uncharacterized protein VICG_01267 [Vittaforma corneae ATCC 50505]ELA41634.1 hypothetical protein VICG_01267 [Vittaforma corneae ATCC 50505]